MKLDFNTVRALSSPTRIKILNEVMENESTPTTLSGDLDRSKSTVSSHLEKLVDAGLVEKDSEEGRKRVVYKPTDKAEAIVAGRERKVKFSITSSALTLVGAVAVFGHERISFVRNSFQSQDQVNTMTTEAADIGTEAARNAASPELLDPSIVKFTGIGLLALSAGFFLYGYTMSRLTG